MPYFPGHSPFSPREMFFCVSGSREYKTLGVILEVHLSFWTYGNTIPTFNYVFSGMGKSQELIEFAYLSDVFFVLAATTLSFLLQPTM